MDKYLPYVNLEFSENGETMVNIRQTKLDGSEHIITVSGANLSPLMFQLKSIEGSLIFGANFTLQPQQQQQQPQQLVQNDLAREIVDSVRDEYAETSAAEEFDRYLNLSLLPPPPPPSRKSGTATKGDLRKRLRDTAHASVGTSTDDLEKSLSPAVATAVVAPFSALASGKSEPDKKKKKKKTTTAVVMVDAATRASSRVVWRCIETIVKNRCVGCSKNKIDHHDVCEDTKPAKIRKYFNEALAGVDMSEIWGVMDEILAVEGDPSTTPSTIYPPKATLETNKVWQSHVKKTILAA